MLPTVSAAIALSLHPPDGGELHEVQLMPDGEFRAADGRGPWVLDEQTGARLVSAFEAQTNPLLIDYEHQALRAQTNGQPAPASGWIRKLSYRAGQGLFGLVQWTDRARQLIRAGEYQFISPAFVPAGKRIERLLPAALTNFPAVDGMRAVTASLDPSTKEGTSVDEFLMKLRAAFGMPEAATEDEILAEAARSRVVDLAQYTPLSAMQALQTELAQLKAVQQSAAVAALVDQALSDGKLLPAQKEWAVALGAQNLPALKKYIETAQPQVPMSPQGSDPARAVALSDEEKRVATALGVSDSDFLAARGAA